MAIALTVSSNITPRQNKKLLNQWPLIMLEAIGHWHFNQCAGIGAPLQTTNNQAGQVFLQSEREYIARHLESAADRLSNDLHYSICPMYFSELIPLGKGVPIQRQILEATYCKMIALGKRAQTLISAGVAVVYSDPYGYGFNTTATITVNTTIANDEIKLYFQVVDGCPVAGDQRYEIEPLDITDNGAGVVTIVANRALFVSPLQWRKEYSSTDPNAKTPNIVDTGTAAGFVTAVDVYRVYTDTSAAVQLLSQDNTVLQNYTGEIVNDELSEFRMGDLCSQVCWDKYPAKVRVNYYAGSPLVNNNVDSELFEACVGIACGNMMSKMGGMSYWSLDLWEKYHAPMVESQGGNLVPVATKMQSNSGYGARYGQAFAWGVAMDRRIEKGVKFF